MVVVTSDELIGCDIEKHQQSFHYQEIIAQHFFAQEQKYFSSNSENKEKFFDYWVAKESYLKAYGKGLSIPLSSFSLEINASHHVKILEDLPELKGDTSWTIKQVHLFDGYSAAICSSGEINELIIYDVSTT